MDEIPAKPTASGCFLFLLPTSFERWKDLVNMTLVTLDSSRLCQVGLYEQFKLLHWLHWKAMAAGASLKCNKRKFMSELCIRSYVP